MTNISRQRTDDIPLDDHSSIVYCKDFLSPDHAAELLSFCLNELPWIQSTIKMFGKPVTIPRLNAWFGSEPYSYSGTRFTALPLPKPLEALKLSVEKIANESFNSVLANKYRDGHDCMGWHSDDERSLGEKPQIASVSLGADRRFLLRKKKDHADKRELLLAHGSLLLMCGECQTQWQHSLPRMRRVQDSRINLTFRFSTPKPGSLTNISRRVKQN